MAKPHVHISGLALDATVNEPNLFIETMYNLTYLAFRTDSTRYATYLLQSMNSGPWTDLPMTSLRLGANHDQLAHNAAGSTLPAMDKLGTYDKFHVDLLAAFLKRMAETPEGNGSMLDHTIVFYGSSKSKTHVNRDYPLMIAGGRGLGLRQGQFHEMDGFGVPLSNLLLTILQRLDVPADSFSDSTGIMRQVV